MKSFFSCEFGPAFEETAFDRGLRQFGMLIMRAVLFLVLFILIVRVALHKDAFESFVFAVALAVGLTPEFLPMITSVTLGRGATPNYPEAARWLNRLSLLVFVLGRYEEAGSGHVAKAAKG